ncbi:MAG: 50S ribosomal protein L11 [Alphaproteobacteria bacterium MarineAlpha5_Bin8]|nr:MAG: 50S ribosomal protein L11 [Alphaproteobacteria bacterium MarineAlpha5_Bin7]PPR48059.1 MAG: 50S ribosomal protein L11 [Alphaproteobacteria bacterium MarineAlpha5_Bin8]|tara:strand:+ start:1311 stop:1739 length:429 start_codon:yes stop_codon:yes gene_type:complete
MAKEILGLIKLQIPAGEANPSPPVGPALGQRGLNIMDFCKAFNEKTKNLEKGSPIPVIITAYKDKKFDFITKLPPVSYYLKKAAKIKKGNSTPGRSLVGKVTIKDIEKIANEKMADLNAINLEGAINMVKGSAVSMGMEIVN